MDATATTQLIEHHLDQMTVTPVHDERSAQQALAHAMAAVGGINQGLVVGPQNLTGPVDGIIEKLEDWIKRLLDKLTEIVKQLAKGTTFSITVGTGISVTVNFPALG
jgi:hypothetical protein